MSAKSQITESAGPGRIVRPVAVGVVFGAIVCVAILLLMSAIISSKSIPQSMIDPMANFAMSVGAFVSGLCCARIIHRNGLMCGLASGVIFTVIVLICSFAVPDNGLGFGALFKTMLILFSAMIGGVLGVNTKKRKK